MRCAIYARISKNHGHVSENVEIQRAECEEYAAAEGWDVVGIFEDDDISASKYSTKPRPGYNALMESVRAGAVDVVLVTEMPRLYRRLEELLDLLYLAQTTPLRKIETTKGTGYSLSTAEGIHNAVAAVNGAMLESAQKSERVKRKHGALAKQGHPSGGGRPYGYDAIRAVKDRQNRTVEPNRLVVNEAEAAVICEAMRLLLEGRSLHGTVRVLNARGRRTMTGRTWTTIALRDVLTNKALLGIRSYNGVDYPGTWPAIVSTEDFDRVQLILKAEQRQRGNHLRGRRSYLLTGLIFCGACGQPGAEGEPSTPGAALVGHGHHVNGQLERRYYCAKVDTAGQPWGCGRVGRIAEPIEALVSEAVLDVLDSPRMAELIGEAAQDSEVAELLAGREAQKLKLGDLIDDYASGLLSREELARAKGVVEAAMDRNRARLDKLQSGRALAAVPVGQSIRQAWAAADLEWRRALVELLVERVIVHPGRPGGHRWPADGSELLKRVGRQWHFDPNKVEIHWKV